MTTEPALAGLNHHFSMAELVERTGVAAPTVRFYLVEGLLPPAVKVAPNRFLYDERHVEAVRLVRLLRERRGLSLEAIGQMLPALLPDLLGRPDAGAFRPEMWRQLLEDHTASATAPSTADRLLAAGLGAFCRHGHADVTVDDVCRAADVAKGSFYRYFGSKEDLFLAAASAVAREVTAILVARAGEGPLEPAGATAVLREALAPYLPVVLDLASLAVQRRPGHARALRSLVNDVRRAMLELAPALDAEAVEATLVHAVAHALATATSDRPALGAEPR
ncbi:MAG TPA: MerR family transcriptional regulator [Acidimicrobiales bacterium]|nr:MerR family transcriptional regulator [Acidimicrobiales bacterium]